MTKIYIDFDGVILDTWELIIKNYLETYHTMEIQENKIIDLMISIGWDYILKNSVEINHSLEKIRQISTIYDVCILTKINSIQEKNAKRKFLLENNIKKMCFVPYTSSKNQYAISYNSILIDDDLKNLEDWEKHGGISIFFNKNLDGIDSYGNTNKKYIIINDLQKIYDII